MVTPAAAAKRTNVRCAGTTTVTQRPSPIAPGKKIAVPASRFARTYGCQAGAVSAGRYPMRCPAKSMATAEYEPVLWFLGRRHLWPYVEDVMFHLLVPVRLKGVPSSGRAGSGRSGTGRVQWSLIRVTFSERGSFIVLAEGVKGLWSAASRRWPGERPRRLTNAEGTAGSGRRPLVDEYGPLSCH